jgi:polyisoprenoid-binding protein YceI
MSATQTSPAAAGLATWTVDPAHSVAQFTVRHLMISNVRGEFTRLAGTIELNEEDLARSSVRVTVDAASISTREPDRDAHLKSPDFLDVAKYPTMTFESTRISRNASGELELTGRLTIRGVTREVTFQVESFTPTIKDPWGNLRRGASASAKINRKDFGLAWNGLTETGGIMVGDEVKITLDLEFFRPAEEKA